MKRFTLAAAMLTGVAFAACRVYDVDVYRNVNGWTSGPPNVNYVSQSFINVCDSALTWASLFVGAANDTGHYEFRVLSYPDGEPIYEGDTLSGPTIHYTYVRADLKHRIGAPELIKGKEYVLKVYHSAGESLNYYYSPANPYRYGHLNPQLGDQSHPEEYFPNDLCARIEGLSRSLTECKAERRRMKDEL
jgi:hypothetical protein